MTEDFINWCCAHSCSEWCKNREDYCPIADEVRERYGKITGTKCEAIYLRRKAEGRKNTMSVYISGVEMPKAHPLYITLCPDGSVHVWDSYGGEDYGTQAIHVPPHGKLIDKDAVSLEGGPYEYDE